MSSPPAWEFFTGTLPKDLFHLITGERLGYGIARETYEFKPDPTLVIKFETASKSFQNALEYDVWDRVSPYKNLAKWYAPVVSISANGSILLMKRTQPIPPEYKLPEKILYMLGDVKRDNFGLLNGRLVCHDYGTGVRFMMDSNKMRKADWS